MNYKELVILLKKIVYVSLSVKVLNSLLHQTLNYSKSYSQPQRNRFMKNLVKSQDHQVVIDHVGIVNKKLAISTEVFEALGFQSGKESKLDVGLNEQNIRPTNIHYMFDNSYIEVIETTGKDYLLDLLNSDCAMHMSLLVSKAISKTHQKFLDAGIEVSSPITNSSRPADHGELKGTARFQWFRFIEPILDNNGMVAVMQHHTRELIFQKNRYQHPNGVYAMEAIYADITTAQGETMTELSGYMDGEFSETNSIQILRVVDCNQVNNALDMKLDKTRSPYVGASFLTHDLAITKSIIEQSGYAFREIDEGIIVDASKKMNMFFEFKTA